MTKEQLRVDLSNLMYALNNRPFRFNEQFLKGYNEHFEAIVCDVCGINLKQLRGKGKYRAIIMARFICIRYLKEYTTKTLAEIGKDYGYIDHTGGSYAMKRHRQFLNSDSHKDYTEAYNAFLERV